MNQNLSYLQQALAVAKTRRGFCAPNPAVGAVVVKENKVLAVGVHQAAGCPHAEIEALNLVQGQVRGATLYVTLEPCCHWGRTPPCTDRIIQEGIAKVVYGYRDPNPRVAGQGEAALVKAGVVCEQVFLTEIADFYESYAFWQAHQRPWITAKLAMTYDGKIAGQGGKPIVITGPHLAEYTHAERKASDAILTTATTVLHDDPALTARVAWAVIPKPLYVLDARLQIPATAQIFHTGAPVTLFHDAALREVPALPSHVVAVPIACPHGLDLGAIVHFLGKQGLHDVWVEAGSTLFTRLIEGGYVQRAFLYLSAVWYGSTGRPGPEKWEKLFKKASKTHYHGVGNDLLCAYHFEG